jgi:hypothetical protein
MLRTLLIAVSLVLGVFAAGETRAMTFERLDGPVCENSPCVLAKGEIRKNTAAVFKAFVRSHDVPAGAVVVFDSPGGMVLQSLALGQAIRDAGLYTAVGRFDRRERQFVEGGECISACAYAFLGGVQRDVARHARLGVHQFSSEPGTEGSLNVSDAQMLMGLIQVYTDRMVGKTTLLTLAARTAPTDTYWLSSAELRNYRVVTY